ncbi:MAG: ATP-binding protein [Deltaproteobacteria bacterium]|nr:ATP-binding protein [Deltaproteobacteria bacterium]
MSSGIIPPAAEQVLRDLNSWWGPRRGVEPPPPAYRRRTVPEIVERLRGKRALIQVFRGPRQTGKTTAVYQIVEDLVRHNVARKSILFVRFDLDVLRDAGLIPIVRWFRETILGGGERSNRGACLLLDEVHRLPRWDEEVKHLFDTFPVRILITGSSSAIVARGQRESLAGRALNTEFPPFSFREVIEAFNPALAKQLPTPLRFGHLFDLGPRAGTLFAKLRRVVAARHAEFSQVLERYFQRGGYPRIYSGDVDDTVWADYLVETVFDRVLSVDVPELFPVDQPALLRRIYLEVARQTGTEIAQLRVVEDLSAAGFQTNQPTVGKYLHILADALLTREFRRYPLARKITARVPSKVTLTDIGIRNAVFRTSPSLWKSDPGTLGPLVETLVQSVIRDRNLQVHFYRDYTEPGNRHSPVEEVDFVAEALDGSTIPIEVKFRKRVDAKDECALRRFRERFAGPFGLLITRDTFRADPGDSIICLPLLEFLLAF